MRAEPKVACCRLGSDLPAASGLATLSSVFVAFCTLGVPQTSTTSSAARQTSPTRIDHAGATVAIAEAAARQASAISAMPAASCTSPLASQATNHKPDGDRRPEPPATAAAEEPAGGGEHRRPEGREPREGSAAPAERG